MTRFEESFSKKDLKKLIPEGLESYISEKSEKERREQLEQAVNAGDVDNAIYLEYLQDVEWVEISRERQELREDMLNAISPFIEEKINKGELPLASFGNHDHLGFVDENYWGHYIATAPKGLLVTVYVKKEIKGDPMDISGSRGKSEQVFVELDTDQRKKLVSQLRKELKEMNEMQSKEGYEWHQWDDRMIEGLEEAIRHMAF